jgi:hypothetical protein
VEVREERGVLEDKRWRDGSRANEGKDAELLGRCAILRQLVEYDLWNVDEDQVPQAMGASPKSVEKGHNVGRIEQRIACTR